MTSVQHMLGNPKWSGSQPGYSPARASNSDHGKGGGRGARSRMSNRHCSDGRGLKTAALLTVSVKGHLLGRERAPRHHVPAASRLFTRVCLLLLTIDKADATPLHRQQPAQSSLGTCSRPQRRWRRQHTSALAPPKATASLLKAGAARSAAFLEATPTLGVPPAETILPTIRASSLPGQVLAS